MIITILKNTHRILQIQKLQNELHDVQQRYESAIKDLCRLESRLQTSQFDHLSEHEVLNKEVYLLVTKCLIFTAIEKKNVGIK